MPTINATQVSPWRTWGNTAIVRHPGGGPTSIPTQQLVNVEYDRPDTWSWFFHVVAQVDDPSVPMPGSQSVQFDLTLGVGRSNVQCPIFWLASFSVAELGTGAITKAAGNITQNAIGGVNYDVRDIPAQAVQVQANAQFFGPPMTFQISAFMAPRSHFRPEWLVDDTPDWARPLA